MIINNGLNKNYYSQRNNEREPVSSCNVTAVINALVSANWPLPEGSGQPEDRLHDFIETNSECLAAWTSIDPTHKIPPQQWHMVLTLGTNLWMQKNVVHYNESATIESILNHLVKGGTGYTSGLFPTTNGHFVTIVGFEGKMEDAKIKPVKWIIKDPWGDYHTKYKVQKGDNIKMSHEDFIEIMRPIKSYHKIFHFVDKKE